MPFRSRIWPSFSSRVFTKARYRKKWWDNSQLIQVVMKLLKLEHSLRYSFLKISSESSYQKCQAFLVNCGTRTDLLWIYISFVMTSYIICLSRLCNVTSPSTSTSNWKLVIQITRHIKKAKRKVEEPFQLKTSCPLLQSQKFGGPVLILPEIKYNRCLSSLIGFLKHLHWSMWQKLSVFDE